jgi:hypothetical protein
MSDANGELVELDVLGDEILRALVAHGGETKSPKLMEYLGLEVRSRFHYRVEEYLEPQGLVETYQPEGKPGVMPAKELSITDVGEQYVEQLDGDDESRGIVERLGRLEEQVDGLRSENKKLREENEELKETIRDSGVDTVVGKVPELTSDVDDLQVTVGNLQDALGDIQTHPVIENQEVAVGLNDIIVMANACRRVIESEVEDGETLVERESEEVREIAGERGLLFDED